LTLQVSQVHFAKLQKPLCYFSIWVFYQVCQVHLTLWTAQMDFKLPTIIKFSGLPEAWISFQSATACTPKTQISPVCFFFWGYLSPPSPLSSLPLSVFGCVWDLMAIWGLRGALSKLLNFIGMC
jgi:hypothetical protein